MEVSRLEPEVVCRLRSGICITSCAHAVEELVLNAIDAGATCIAVRLNLQFFKIQVVDNGEGIPVDNLKHIGERYMTSKCHTLEDLTHLKSGGFRGEALSSLKDVTSVLEIVSRHYKSEKTFCKIFKHGRPLSTSLSIEPRPSRGTTITILDFLYNMPVRRKCISEALDLEQCRKCIENIAVMHPGVSFSLRSDTTGEICLQTRKCNLPVSVFSQLFGHQKATSLKKVTKTQGRYSVEGYISTEGHVSKDLQFIYVNKRYVSKTKIHKLINKILSKALFTRQKMYFKDTTPNALNDSPSKNQIRYSIFILNIICPFNEYDIIFEPRKTMVEFENWDAIMELVQAAMLDFLISQKLICPSESSNALLLNASNSEKPEIRDQHFAKLPHNYGKDIVVENAKNALFSATARRVANSNRDETTLNEGESRKDSVAISFYGNEGTSAGAKLVNFCTEVNGNDAGLLQETPKPGLCSSTSSCDSELSANNSESLIQPVMLSHTVETKNNDTYQKSCKEIFCPESIDLNLCSVEVAGSSENVVGDASDVADFPAENSQKLFHSNQGHSSIKSSLFQKNERRNALRSTTALSDSQFRVVSSFAVRNPILLNTPVESSISLFQKHTAHSESLPSDEFTSPEESELPDFSVIPSKNPILLRLPMKSSLSLLEKHAKRTKKFTELKDKFQFNASKKQIKSFRGAHKNVSAADEKKHQMHDRHYSKENFPTLKNALNDQSLLHFNVQRQAQNIPNCTEDVSSFAQKDGLDSVSSAAIVKRIFEESDAEEICNNVTLSKEAVSVSVGEVNNSLSTNLECTKGNAHKVDESSSHMETSENLGQDFVKTTDKNPFFSRLFSHESEQSSSSTVFAPEGVEEVKNFNKQSCQLGLFKVFRKEHNVTEQLHAKSREWEHVPQDLNAALNVPFGMGKVGLHIPASDTVRRSKLIYEKMGISATTLTADEQAKYKQSCNSDSDLVHGNDTHNLIRSYDHHEVAEKHEDDDNRNDENIFSFQLFSYKNHKMPCISDGEGSGTEQMTNKFSCQSVFLEACRETLDTLCQAVSENSDWVENPEDFKKQLSKSETTVRDASLIRTFPETQPFSVTVQAESFGFEPELDRENSVDEVEEIGNFIHTDNCCGQKVANKCSEKRDPHPVVVGTCDSNTNHNSNASGSEFNMEIATEGNDLLANIKGASVNQNENFGTHVSESCDDLTGNVLVQQLDKLGNSLGSANILCIPTDNKDCMGSSSEVLVKGTDSLESEALSTVNVALDEPSCTCTSIPDSSNNDVVAVKEHKCEKNVRRSDELCNTAVVPLSVDATKRVRENCVISNTLVRDKHDVRSPTQNGLKFGDSSHSSLQNKPVPNKMINSDTSMCYQSKTISLNDTSSDTVRMGSNVQVENLNTDIRNSTESGNLPFEPIDKTQNTADFMDQSSFASCYSCPASFCKDSVKSCMLRTPSINNDESGLGQLSVSEAKNYVKIDKILGCDLFKNSSIDGMPPQATSIELQGDVQIIHQQKQLPVDNSEDLFPSITDAAGKPPPVQVSRSGSTVSTIPVPSQLQYLDSYFGENLLDKHKNKIETVSLGLNTNICRSNSKSASDSINQVNNFSVPELKIPSIGVSSSGSPQMPQSSLDSHHAVAMVNGRLKTGSPFSFDSAHSKLQDVYDSQKPNQQPTETTRVSYTDPSLASADFKNQQNGNDALSTKISGMGNILSTYNSGNSLQEADRREATSSSVECKDLLFTSLSNDDDSEVIMIGDLQSLSSVTVPEINKTTPKHFDDKDHSLSDSTANDGKPIISLGSRWFSRRDPVTHEVVYFDCVTGNSSYSDPAESFKALIEKEEQLHLRQKTGQKGNSHFFLSHNSTPFLPRPPKLRKKCNGNATPGDKSDFIVNPVELKDSLMNYLGEMEDNDLAKKWKPGQMNAAGQQVEEMFNSWENPMFLRCVSEIDLPAISIGNPQQNQLKMYSIINSYRFSKTAFSNLQVIGQVDCKFLACIVQDVNENTKGKKLLVLFDQHAVHERIRLEQLTDDLFEVDRQGQKVVKSAELSSPLTIRLKLEEIRMLKTYHNKLALLGLKLLILDSQDVVVHTVPTCLIERENNDLKRKRQPVTAIVVENLIREWLISLEQTRSTSSVLPKTLIGILNSQACRGAVKFGDPLDLGQCQQLMQSLSTCKLPFQCAHGRPSLAPLLDFNKITDCSRKKPKPDLSKLTKMKSFLYS